MVPTQGFGEYPHSAASFGHIQDPRHQKLVVEQQRAASGGTPIQSPSHSSKHVSCLLWLFCSLPIVSISTWLKP